MAVPWRAAEAMHWQLGEADMARRAGVVPFSLSSVSMDAPPPPSHRASPSRGHSHSQSHPSNVGVPGSNVPRYSRPASAHGGPSSVNTRATGGSSARSIAARRDSTPRSAPPRSSDDGRLLAAIGSGMPMGMGREGKLLPSVAEMTTGVSPYNTPAYAMSMSMGGGYSSPGPLLPSISTIGMGPIRSEGKRRASPELGQRETSRRKQ
jgi:hypothetical protein